MVENKLLNQISNDFNDLVSITNILGIMIYGSYVSNKMTDRSDIDICIIAPTEDPFKLLSLIWEKVNTVKRNYDVRLFTELPLYIKIQIIENGVLVYSPNKYDLYEYFFLYRKLWNDQKHRQQLSREELLKF